MLSKFFGAFSFGFWVFIIVCVRIVASKLVKAIEARNSDQIRWSILKLVLMLLIITGLYFLGK